VLCRPKRILKHGGCSIRSSIGSLVGSLVGSFREFGIEPWRVLSIDLVSMCHEACMKHAME